MSEAQQAKLDVDEAASASVEASVEAAPVAAAASEGVVVAQKVDTTDKVDDLDLPLAKEVFIECEDDNVDYTGVAAGPYASYFVRSDGKVERTLYKGKISSTLIPEEGTKYIQASAGEYATYLLRDDGVVIRVKSEKDLTPMNPPPGKKFIEVTSGEYASYLLLDDNTVQRTTGSAKISVTIKPPSGVKYIAVSAGTYASYFLRSDGSVDRTQKKGVISHSISPPEESSYKYIGVGAAEYHTYIVRDDGWIDRTSGYGTIDHAFEPPPGVKYIAVSDMFAVTTHHSQYSHKDSPWQMYFIRDDGAVDRVVRMNSKKIERTINPPPGLKYICASSGLYNSYFLRSDGVVAKVSCGNVKKSIFAGKKDDSESSCNVM